VDEVSPGTLVAAAASGDRDAWDALVARFSGLMWSVARGFRLDQADASDVIQTAWLKLLEHLDRLHDPDHVGAWLATTTRNECLRHLRKTGRERPVDVDDLDVVDDRSPGLDAALLRDETAVELWEAFETLNDRCRTLLRMLMTDPPPAYNEVSAVLDMPIGSIGPTRGRCLARLRTALAGISDSPSGSSSGEDPPSRRRGSWRDGTSRRQA
jgi:RNA polymerase sigma factor (sigma-70 family)